MEFLLWSEKSNVIQQRLTLLTKRFSFSEFVTSLNGTKGSVPATTVDGKTAELEGTGPELERERSPPESGFADFRGSLLKN